MYSTDWILAQDESFQYQMLDRLKSDCDYYLGNGNRSPNHLWAKNEKEHITHMKAVWNNFSNDKKPEWLAWEKILEYESKMTSE